MNISKIKFNVNYPSVTWSDSSSVPLDLVSEGALIEYRDKLAVLINDTKFKSWYIDEKKEELKALSLYIVKKFED